MQDNQPASAIVHSPFTGLETKPQADYESPFFNNADNSNKSTSSPKNGLLVKKQPSSDGEPEVIAQMTRSAGSDEQDFRSNRLTKTPDKFRRSALIEDTDPEEAAYVRKKTNEVRKSKTSSSPPKHGKKSTFTSHKDKLPKFFQENDDKKTVSQILTAQGNVLKVICQFKTLLDLFQD